MVLRQTLTPEAFLSAPRRSPAVPSPSGALAFFSVSTHTFADDGASKGTTKKELRLLELTSGAHQQLELPDDLDTVQDLTWIPGSSGPDELLWLRPGEAGTTKVVVATVSWPPKASIPSYVAATVPGPIKALKLRGLPDGRVAFAAAGRVGADGRLHNEKALDAAAKKAAGPGGSGRIHDTWQVREWDTYLPAQRYSVWHSELVRKGKGTAVDVDADAGRWSLSSPLHNALARAPHLEAPASIYKPGDASDAFDAGAPGIVLVARDPAPANAETIGCSFVYYVPLASFAEPADLAPVRVDVAGESTPGPLGSHGHATNPRFSPDGALVAFLRAPLACPADVRLHVGRVSTGAVFDVALMVGGEEAKPQVSIIPDAFEFAPSSEAVLLAAPDCGRRRLFSLALHADAQPRALPGPAYGSVSAFFAVAGSGSVLVTGSSLVESCFYYVVNVDEATFSEPRLLAASSSSDAVRFGLSHARQVSELYFEGGGDGYCVHAWVVRPSRFDPGRRYPLALVVHGGPESMWTDEWHLRWNAAVWAEQGYVVVLPNITGSTGFGLDHTTRIYGSWGGYPYEDLVQCVDGLRSVPYIDLDRAVLAGGSYGGYMVNWVNGNALAREFKAAVTHDSVFSTTLMNLTSDFPDSVATFRGSPLLWRNYDAVNRWNPARPDLLARWGDNAPPTLVIHSDRDFRCVLTDGLAAFRTLQLQGVPSRLLTFPDENHVVLNVDNALAWHRTVFDWINRYGRDGV